jgi:hypothetical protein
MTVEHLVKRTISIADAEKATCILCDLDDSGADPFAAFVLGVCFGSKRLIIRLCAEHQGDLDVAVGEIGMTLAQQMVNRPGSG